MAPFAGGPRRLRGKLDRRSMDLQHVVETAVLQSIVPDTLPGSQLQINVLITDADGSVDACAVNAVTLAVADAGMRTLARSTCKCAMQDI
jgi:exosome complex component RRP41